MENYLTSLFRLFFPEQCAACGKALPEGARLLCPFCRWDMPITGYSARHDNPVFQKFGGLIPITEASSYLFFTGSSRYRSMIHAFKYHGQWNISRRLGEIMGDALRESGLYNTVDRVIPIPLHRRRRLKRGYNQSEYLAEGVAKALGKPLDTRSVSRSTYNPSQATTKHRSDRWENVAGIFSIRRPERLDGHHILLVDDVLTTGATLVSCAESILRTQTKCRISIATLAVSAYELFGRRGQGGL